MLIRLRYNPARANHTQQQAIVALVEKIIAAKDGDHNADTSELEKQIDTLVYELYGLSAEEIKFIEGGMDAASE